VTQRAIVLVASLSWLVVSSCGRDFEPPDRSARVERAALRYSAALFDTVGWDDQEVRLLQGNTAYAERCRRCHGPFGRGETEYARSRGLDVPSLAEATRTMELDSVRRSVYIGHEDWMPIFGEGGLTLREIDATAAYVVSTLTTERDP
jgi:mono/diheme cytochrome c family protein